MSTPTVPSPMADPDPHERLQAAAEKGDWETYRLLLPLGHPYRDDLESPLHEDACAHMAPGCPCTPPNDTPEDAS